MNRRDISPVIWRVLNAQILWSVSDFDCLLEQLSLARKVSYWRNEENWAQIMQEGKVVAYIWRLYPLMIIETSAPDDLIRSANEACNGLALLRVDSFTDDRLSIDDRLLCDRLGSIPGFSELLHADASFSVHDLWFYTVNL